MWKNMICAMRDWLKRQGFQKLGWYGALALLLVILGTASGAYRNRWDKAEPAPTLPPVAAMAVNTPEPMAAMFRLPTPSPEPTPEPVAFVWPLEGDIIGEFAPEHLIWSETLNQWQNHPGIDISAAAGEAVLACADGTVREVWDDPLWGYVVEIEHREGYDSVYANLNTPNMVSAGETVAAGQTIGAVGNTADCESALPWHLHFELRQDGRPVDLQKLIGEA